MRFPLALILAVPVLSGAAAPAFPGAEGFGAATPGGRGGKVLIVSNLNDSGPGSLREAVSTAGPRIVIFRVGGIIDLKSAITVKEPFITLAAQTAPGDGVCIRGNQFSIATHDVVIRFLRVRPGDISGGEVDGISIGGDSRNVILDHCSATWSVDEALSPSGAISNITVQWSIIGESLNHSVHKKGPHGYGSLARAAGGVTFHHNLWAHNSARNPRLGDNYNKPPWPMFDVRNNVMYDYGGMCSGMTGDDLSANYVANYIRPGPSSNRKRGIIVFTDTAKTRYYQADNVIEGDIRLFDRVEQSGRKFVTLVDAPFEAPAVRTTSAAEALEAVLEGAGAVRPVRDAVDARIVRQVRTRSGGIIDSQWEVGGWPEYRSGRPPLDTDRDGMPDEWEKAQALNANNAADAAGDRDGDGWTNIEEYLNSMAGSQRKR